MTTSRTTTRSAFVALAAIILGSTVLAACTPGFTSGSAGGSSGGGTTAPAATCAEPGLPTTVAYERLPGVPANLTSLDVHASKSACRAPVVLWVHGGGYHAGDKTGQMADKVELFNSKGWILVSINYRLTKAGDPSSAQYPDHYEDVATAVAWVHDNIDRYGGDPARLALLGHSAGADIVANVTTNPTYLAHHGMKLSDLRCAGPFDTAGFDKPSVFSPEEQAQWKAALGNDPNYAKDTSATLLAKPGIGIPATISVYRGSPWRQQIEQAFLAKLSSVGVHTVTIDARTLSHGQVNSRIGAPGDTVMTPPLISFLTTCFR